MATFTAQDKQEVITADDKTKSEDVVPQADKQAHTEVAERQGKEGDQARAINRKKGKREEQLAGVKNAPGHYPEPDAKCHQADHVGAGLQNAHSSAKSAASKPGSEANIMVKIHYRIVAHDGGWAYKLNDVFSEPFPTKAAALAAAKLVAAEQHVPGDTTHIEYEDELGRWHTELSEGSDRPDADVAA